MKCVSCDKEINPQWGHAIELNSCPFCGNVIMDEALKDALSSLKDIMQELQTYPIELNDWLFSNHQYIKTDSEDLYKYISKDKLDELLKNRRNDVFDEKKSGAKKVVKIKNENGEEEEVLAEVIQDQKTTNDFHKRAQSIKNDASPEAKTERIKAMLSQIKSGGYSGSANPAMLSDQEREMTYLSNEDGAEEDIHSSIEMSNLDEFDSIPTSVLQMASKAAEPNLDPNRLMQTENYNKKDHASLQRMVLKPNESRNNALSGKGSFSR